MAFSVHATMHLPTHLLAHLAGAKVSICTLTGIYSSLPLLTTGLVITAFTEWLQIYYVCTDTACYALSSFVQLNCYCMVGT